MSLRDAAGLLFLARADARDGMILLNATSRNAAYHAQQAAEKLIKALLKWKGISYPALQHHLDGLICHFPQDDPWRARLEPLCWLQAYATTFRYADGGRIRPAPTPARLNAAIDDCLRLIDFASTEMRLQLTDDEKQPFRMLD